MCVNHSLNTKHLDTTMEIEFFSCIRRQHHHAVMRLIHEGIDVNCKDHLGMSPLHIAAETGDEFIVSELLKRGARVNAKSKYGHTPLHSLVHSENTKLAEMLIDSGGDLNLQNNDGNTCLHLAIIVGVPAIIDLFLSRGADPNILSTNPTGTENYSCLDVIIRSNTYGYGIPEETVSRIITRGGRFHHFSLDGTVLSQKKYDRLREEYELALGHV